MDTTARHLSSENAVLCLFLAGLLACFVVVLGLPIGPKRDSGEADKPPDYSKRTVAGTAPVLARL